MAIDPQRMETHPGGPMSVEDYLQLERNTVDAKYEYVDGVARLMSGGSVGHDQIAFNVRVAVGVNFRSGPCGVFGSDVQVLIGLEPNRKEHYVYPDATVSCDVADRRRGNKLIRSPRIVVEVLSPSTEPLDRGAKLEAYKACPTIQEILLISQFAQHVEVYQRGEDETAWSHSFYAPGSMVELTSVDVHLSMDEIYQGIDFNEPLLEE